jgi:hypothetical protein
MWMRHLLFFGLILAGVMAIAATLYPPAVPVRASHFDPAEFENADFRDAVARVNDSFRKKWASETIESAPPASDFVIARRLSLALTGTIPSLQEIRQLEAHEERERVQWWLAGILEDRRYADYVGERLARAYVGTEAGPFLLFRRHRFVSWLSDELMHNRPYDQLVRSVIASDGLWTDKPATNFITVTADQGNRNQPNPERLAARVTRAFLGIRLDCAQCHDHFFEKWKQADFRGLAAFFGQTRIGFVGAYDDREATFQLEDRKSGAMLTFEPRVPFLADLVSGESDERSRLAAWMTHPRNPYFALEAVNRVWAIMLGRPMTEYVDDVSTSVNERLATLRQQMGDGASDDALLQAVLDGDDALAILARDFIAHKYDLRRLIQVIAAVEPFRAISRPDSEVSDAERRSWAVFPRVHLRPEQVVGSIEQAASLTTIDANSHIIVRLTTTIGINEFVKRYGDTGEDEFNDRGETIPQRLLLMNGDLVDEKTKQWLFNAATRIGWLAPDDARAVRSAYLAVLTREPTEKEAAYFEAWLRGTRGEERSERMQDLYWALINAKEFTWNH